jgi:hypothetical protein
VYRESGSLNAPEIPADISFPLLATSIESGRELRGICGSWTQPKLNTLRPNFPHYMPIRLMHISFVGSHFLATKNSARFGPETYIQTQLNLRDMVT